MITNKTVRERTGQDTLEPVIRQRRLRWFGHTYRMDSNKIAQVMDWTLPHFRRKRGRPTVMDFNSEKRSGFVRSDMGWSSGSNEGSLGMERLYCPMCFYSMSKD